MKYYDLNNIVASTIQTAITDTNAVHVLTSLGSTQRYALTGFSFVNSVAATGFMDILGSSDYPPLYRIPLPGDCVPSSKSFDPPIPCGENQNIRLKTNANLNVTGTIEAVKDKI